MTPKSELSRLRKRKWHRAGFFFFVITGIVAAVGTKLKMLSVGAWALFLGSTLFFTEIQSPRDLLLRYVVYFIVNGLPYLLILRWALSSRLPEVRLTCFVLFGFVWMATGVF